METIYQDFLKSKHKQPDYNGFEVAKEAINPAAFPFQNAIVRWALLRGAAAIFAERGLGKTLMQLAWAEQVVKKTGGRVLILAPLAVTDQTVREGEKFLVPVHYAASQAEAGSMPIVITNYENLHKFDASKVVGVVLDESSILKNFTGKIKTSIIEAFKTTPYKLAASATPAPNDYLELGNHAEFLGVMPSNEMIARWFINDTMKAGDYRLKGHAAKDFWRWITSWAVCISHPRDLGDEYDMPGYDLPELRIIEHLVDTPEETIKRTWADGKLVVDGNPSSTKLHRAKRESLQNRTQKALELAQQMPQDEPLIIWCDTNYEADKLKPLFPDAIEVRGSEKPTVKKNKLLSFSDNTERVIITKPDLAGYGLNWQHCPNMIFVGVNYSFEQNYQAIGRSYRFGQKKPVNVHMIYAQSEGDVLKTIKDKQAEFIEMQTEMRDAIREHGLFREDKPVELTPTEVKVQSGKNWEMHLGDCVPFTEKLSENSLDFSVYSPPFSSLYIYSDKEADMGNSASMEEFLEHYEHLLKALYKATRPGRLTAVHVKDLPLYKNSAGWFGIEDFSGLVSTLHRRCGWVFHSRITIWKDPVVEMEKTNSHGLLHKNFGQRTQVCRTGLPDYLMVFAKPDPEGMGKDVLQLRTPGDYIGTNPPKPHEYLSSFRQRTPEWYPGTVEQCSGNETACHRGRAKARISHLGL